MLSKEEKILYALHSIKSVLNDHGFEDIINELALKDGSIETIDCINVLQEFIVDYVNSNQPYKFEDLRPYMFVFDKHFNGWGEVIRVIETYIDKYGNKIIKSLATGDSTLQTIVYREGRFYPVIIGNERR